MPGTWPLAANQGVRGPRRKRWVVLAEPSGRRKVGDDDVLVGGTEADLVPGAYEAHCSVPSAVFRDPSTM